MYMMHGGDSKQVSEMLSEHPEKKFLRNLLMALRGSEEGDGGKRKGAKAQSKGPHTRQV